METDHVVWSYPDNLYFMYWFIWIIRFICRKANQRDRDSEGTWRVCKQDGHNPFKRFLKARFHFIDHCNTCCMAGCAQMAGELSLSHFAYLEIICSGRDIGGIDRTGDGELPGN